MRLSLLSLILAFDLANAQTESTAGVDRDYTIVAHGVLMSLAFLIFFPFGALTVRVLSFKHMIWIHAGIQILALAIVTTGVGLGIWIATTKHRQLDKAHPIIGLVVFALLFFQPVSGLVYHLINRKPSPGSVAFVRESHKWLGRVLLVLGAINGGLGLQLSANTRKGEIAYGVVAGVVFVVYGAVDVVMIMKEKRRTRDGESGGEKVASSRDSPVGRGNEDGEARMVKV